MARITNAGYRFIHDPHVIVCRSQRKNIKLFSKQIFNYGRGRMEQTILYPASFSSTHFIPLAFLLYIIGLFFAGSAYYWIPMIGYAVLLASFSLLAASKGQQLKSFLVSYYALSYGAGTIWGFVWTFKKKKRLSCGINMKHVDIEKL